MKITEVVDPLEFRIENHGWHHGQSDRMLIATRGGEEVGSIEFSDYQNQPQVQMISVPDEFRRQGIGTALLKRLQAEYPGVEINMTTPTTMGAALINSMPHQVTVNQEYVELSARLEELQSREAEFQKIADEVAANPTPEGRAQFYQIVDRWNEVSDQMHDITRRLSDMSAATRTFST